MERLFDDNTLGARRNSLLEQYRLTPEGNERGKIRIQVALALAREVEESFDSYNDICLREAIAKLIGFLESDDDDFEFQDYIEPKRYRGNW